MQVELDEKLVGELISEGLRTRAVNGEQVSADGSNVKILVLQRAWVVVGQYRKEGQEHVLTEASVIRVWGTSKGVGQLALEGPLTGTKLDPCGLVRSHELATVMVIDCDDTKWDGKL